MTATANEGEGKGRPIIFSAPMVLALLDGRKTQTRRLTWTALQNSKRGDFLWVRERWATDRCDDHLAPRNIPRGNPRRQFYFGEAIMPNWHTARPSIHMPRWVSRLTLEVTDIRLQRLHDITDADAFAEGVKGEDGDYRADFEALWGSIHSPQCWAVNPEVVALTFVVHKQNIDSLPTGRTVMT